MLSGRFLKSCVNLLRESSLTILYFLYCSRQSHIMQFVGIGCLLDILRIRLVVIRVLHAYL